MYFKKVIFLLLIIAVMFLIPIAYSFSSNKTHTYFVDQGGLEINPMLEEEIGEETIIVEDKVSKEDIILRKELERICSCESLGDPNSGGSQYDRNGNVIRGHVNNLDIGLCQINLYYWGEKADELGYDVFTREGNIQMANYIYDLHGTQPWNASKACWQ